jgi:arylsulfatase
MYHPEDAPRNMASEFHFTGDIKRMPEFTAPKLGIFDNRATIDAEIPAKADGVLYALGGFSGGVTCYLKENILYYEYNLFEVERTVIKSKSKLPAGKAKIEIEFTRKPHSSGLGHLHAGEVVVKSNGKEVARGTIPTLATLAFTANDCFDIGTDEGSPVSLDYYHKAPYKFNGKINIVDVVYMKGK